MFWYDGPRQGRRRDKTHVRRPPRPPTPPPPPRLETSAIGPTHLGPDRGRARNPRARASLKKVPSLVRGPRLLGSCGRQRTCTCAHAPAESGAGPNPAIMTAPRAVLLDGGVARCRWNPAPPDALPAHACPHESASGGNPRALRRHSTATSSEAFCPTARPIDTQRIE